MFCVLIFWHSPALPRRPSPSKSNTPLLLTSVDLTTDASFVLICKGALNPSVSFRSSSNSSSLMLSRETDSTQCFVVLNSWEKPVLRRQDRCRNEKQFSSLQKKEGLVNEKLPSAMLASNKYRAHQPDKTAMTYIPCIVVADFQSNILRKQAQQQEDPTPNIFIIII